MQSVTPAIGIFGSGAVARALGRALHERGVAVAALSGRDATRAARAAARIGPDVEAVDAPTLVRRARHLLVAVSDSAIPQVAAMLADAGCRGGVALHTCGSCGPEALAPLAAAGVACGVLHPLQTIPPADDGWARLSGITFGVGGDAEAVAVAEALARALDGRILHVSPQGFPAYHAAAALVGNGIAALVDGAVALMERAGVGRHDAVAALGPLCRASLENVLADGPDAALTGPVARGDAGTVRMHLAAVRAAPGTVADLYRAVTKALVRIGRRRGLDAGAAAQIDALLDG